jgi:hypothetical protein
LSATIANVEGASHNQVKVIQPDRRDYSSEQEKMAASTRNSGRTRLDEGVIINWGTFHLNLMQVYRYQEVSSL